MAGQGARIGMPVARLLEEPPGPPMRVSIVQGRRYEEHCGLLFFLFFSRSRDQSLQMPPRNERKGNDRDCSGRGKRKKLRKYALNKLFFRAFKAVHKERRKEEREWIRKERLKGKRFVFLPLRGGNLEGEGGRVSGSGSLSSSEAFSASFTRFLFPSWEREKTTPIRGKVTTHFSPKAGIDSPPPISYEGSEWSPGMEFE